MFDLRSTQLKNSQVYTATHTIKYSCYKYFNHAGHDTIESIHENASDVEIAKVAIYIYIWTKIMKLQRGSKSTMWLINLFIMFTTDLSKL